MVKYPRLKAGITDIARISFCFKNKPENIW